MKFAISFFCHCRFQRAQQHNIIDPPRWHLVCTKAQKTTSRARSSLRLGFSVKLFVTGEAVQNYRNATKLIIKRLMWDFDNIVLLTLGYKPTDRKEKLQTFPSAWVLFLVGIWHERVRWKREDLRRAEWFRFTP